MRYLAFGHRLPASLSVPLFGDRKRYGVFPVADDPTWQEWLNRDTEIYNANQRQSVGRVVNDAGYQIMRRVDLTDKRVLEIGPGALDHIEYWTGRPAEFVCVDVRASFLGLALDRLTSAGVRHRSKLIPASQGVQLPFEDRAFDVILSFYALEHIHDLERHLDEVVRILKMGGMFVGAIPCEGGVGWGVGRLLTSRRWLTRHTNIDVKKLICWEHPNFADKILNALLTRFERRVVEFWPLRVPLIDLNLVVRFVATKPPR